MTSTIRAALALAILACGPASAYTLYTANDDGSGPPLRWSGLGAELTFDPQAPQEVAATVAHDVILASFRNWSNHRCDDATTDYRFDSAGYVPGRAVGFRSEKGAVNENLVVWVTSSDAWEHGPGVVALTSLTYDVGTGEVVDADLELNDAEFQFSASEQGPLPSEMDLANAVAHEAGHFLGLDHSDGKLSTMYRNAKPGETIKRDPSQDDIDGFCALYGPSAIPPAQDPAPANDRGFQGCSAGHPGSTPGALLLLLGLVALGLGRARRFKPEVEPR